MALKGWIKTNFKYMVLIAALGLLTIFLFTYKLSSLVGGLSPTELTIAKMKLGLSGLINDPLYLPIKIVRSVVYFLVPEHGQTLTRLPSVFFGVLAVGAFGICMKLWHGARTGLLITLLFITSAWTLHVARSASNDVLYLWAVPSLLLVQALLHNYKSSKWVWALAISVWSVVIFIPGLVWLILAQIIIKRKDFIQTYRQIDSKLFKYGILVLPLCAAVLLGLGFSNNASLALWLGYDSPSVWTESVKNFLGVPLHLIFFGPLYPDIWLGHAPIFDIFVLICVSLGLYFYVRNYRAARSQTLFSFAIILWILVGTLGLKPYSGLVVLSYMIAGAGLAYLTKEWFKVFPRNPLARGVGIAIIAVIVGLSCIYNLRAYFFAWPHNNDTRQHFSNRL